MLPNNLAFVDIETTGGSVNYDRIIEIGIIRIENDSIVREYNTLVNPEMYVSPFIEELTGINREDLEHAPLFLEISDKVAEILSGCIFVAHNVRFDYGFIRRSLKTSGIYFTSKQLCTVKLSKRLFPEFSHHDLDSIIKRFGFACKRRHRAFDDAMVLWKFYNLLKTNIEQKALQETINIILKKPSVPLGIAQSAFDNLPELPGVYIFYGPEKMPLYIGKSKNIKERVMSHFSGDHSSNLDMKISQQIVDIDTIITSGELGALFKESYLVKKMQPLYNKKLRLKRKLVVIKKQIDDNGYDMTIIDTVNSIHLEDIEGILGIFRSKKQAKDFLTVIAKEYNLCDKLLNLESTKGACFGYHLQRCKGACIKKENCIKYNIRITEAFGKYKIKSWPFSGPIIIMEKNAFHDKKEMFLVDKWCLLGSSAHDENHDAQEFTTEEYSFDLDTYKILLSYLRNKSNSKNIKSVSEPVLNSIQESSSNGIPK